jgi:DNA polymerase-3 subunit gamma/tau
MLSRIERLERVENITTTTTPSPAPTKTTAPDSTPKIAAAPKAADKPADKAKEVLAEVVKEETVGGGDSKEALPESPSQAVSSKTFDIAGLRRLWPDVIENVKKRRRLTWSLLSASAQIVAVDEKLIVNAGARDSFVRSESDEILRQAFIEIVGIDRKIEVVVDASIDTTSTPEARSVRKDEAPSDKNLLSGAALLAAELGATVIPEKKKN